MVFVRRGEEEASATVDARPFGKEVSMVADTCPFCKSGNTQHAADDTTKKVNRGIHWYQCQECDQVWGIPKVWNPKAGETTELVKFASYVGAGQPPSYGAWPVP